MSFIFMCPSVVIQIHGSGLPLGSVEALCNRHGKIHANYAISKNTHYFQWHPGFLRHSIHEAIFLGKKKCLFFIHKIQTV